jgi:outer membrane protein
MKAFFKAMGVAGVGAVFFTSFFINASAYAGSDFESLWDKERFQIRVRGIVLAPDDDSSVNIGGKTDVDESPVMPEVDLTYFITDKIAVEAIAATTPHEVYYNGNTNLGDAWALPPTVTLQYHPLKGRDFSPYFGAGVNYSLFYGENSGTGFTDLDLDGGFGFALQAGFDYWLNDHWGLNLDVKKIYLDVDASLNGNTILSDIELDPYVVGAGVSYRF